MDIVALGALCELKTIRNPGRSLDFDLEEFVDAADGSRLVLHDDRGWSTHIQSTIDDPSLTHPLTVDDVVRGTFTTLLPDGHEPSDTHDWQRLVRLLTTHDTHVTVDELRSLPYTLMFGPRLRTALADRGEHRTMVSVDWDKVDAEISGLT